MYFGLSEEQQFFQESINKFLEDNVTVDALKAYRTGENKDLTKIIGFMTNDKKNNDKKINLILLKKIGLTTKPGSQKFSGIELIKLR